LYIVFNLQLYSFQRSTLPALHFIREIIWRFYFLDSTNFPESITPRLDSDFLAKFIRTKDYRIDKAQTAVEKYYACIHANYDFFKGIRPSDFTKAIRTDCVSLAKKHNRPNGVGLIIVRAKNWMPKEIQVRDFQLGFIQVAEEYLKQPELQENGISAIVDLKGLRLDQVWAVTVHEMWRTAQIALVSLKLPSN